MHFDSPEATTLYLDGLVQRLRDSHASEAAHQLHAIVHESAWTTSSEWLGEIKLLLVRVSRTEPDKIGLNSP